ncbi:MAG: hypothetical protein UT48_C0015G0010 [Parcubacteria group bacterium GW2011_GWE2_39_37]|uniref:Uncharacterized protein n=1 Tax=Candidatus Falkowbacteria bacterium GW2011_GWF2_39_8 TaxID=1618642 RepID=A0A0G0T340_9BACT|nr:MAG: hypothetical protein UT48_C0015G0010 [Parcubacteria group bacterium GW2011_GWE2_39_37]KKR32232.1 MAG: hypothetical protein UT64_C0039G0011 [Candidatus Falkowbacteria bacterium GW2011_GWF2_39_8]
MTLTPEEFNKIPSKEDLNRLEEKVEKIEEKINTVMDVLDGISNKLDVISQEATSNIAAHDRMSEELDNHDLRIKNLELKTI